MGEKPISFRDKDGNFVSAADVWNAEKLEELFNTLNPNRRFRLEREKLAKEKAITFEQYHKLLDSTLPIQNVINTLRQEEENGGQANA